MTQKRERRVFNTKKGAKKHRKFKFFCVFRAIKFKKLGKLELNYKASWWSEKLFKFDMELWNAKSFCYMNVFFFGSVWERTQNRRVFYRFQLTWHGPRERIGRQTIAGKQEKFYWCKREKYFSMERSATPTQEGKQNCSLRKILLGNWYTILNWHDTLFSGMCVCMWRNVDLEGEREKTECTECIRCKYTSFK